MGDVRTSIQAIFPAVGKCLTHRRQPFEKGARVRALVLAVLYLLRLPRVRNTVPPSTDGGWCERPVPWHDNGGYHQVSGGSREPAPTLRGSRCRRLLRALLRQRRNARHAAVRSGGELFVASPPPPTSGGPQGQEAFSCCPTTTATAGRQDDHVALGLASTQGLLFADGGFYSKTRTRIMLEPYAKEIAHRSATPQQRSPTSTCKARPATGRRRSTSPTTARSNVFERRRSGRGLPGAASVPRRHPRARPDEPDGPRRGRRGLRNPIYVRCHHDGQGACFAKRAVRATTAAT